jgi:ribosomal protein S1
MIKTRRSGLPCAAAKYLFTDHQLRHFMDQHSTKGTIIFIHHEKNFATIEYLQNGKKKTINGNIDEKEQQQLKEKKLIKKVHSFRIGDEVSFLIMPSLKRDKMVATCIEFQYNNAYSNLVHKAVIENRFVGYLKKVEEGYFVKETGSYILFPLVLSPWELQPDESRLNEPVFFKLDHIDKPNNITASLFKSEYIPEYLAAVRHFNNQTPVDALVYKLTPFGIFIHLFNGKISARIPLAKDKTITAELPVKIGDHIKVLITYISPVKIVVEKTA